MPTWLIVGASRGIGLEFVRQLLAKRQNVIATVRDPEKAADLWSMAGSAPLGALRFLLCDVASDELSSVRFLVSPDMNIVCPDGRRRSCVSLKLSEC